MKPPLLPALSRQVPLADTTLIVASMWIGAPPGAVTVVSPKPTEPSGLGNARPTTLARRAAPHRSSVPSTWYCEPSWTTVTVSTLQ